ncbi:MAG: sigma-70 family RNA polymerase sigma factor [Cyanobacteria bacterium]|nr:sigma-70 family RNA polymerase sigma factor [Cyanobacteriota bacterium]MDA1246129.1 sigma-70 family RNA polymerase sigma factor [Cyanobacteriota bacterium]
MTQSIKSKSICQRALKQRNLRVNEYYRLVTPIAVHYCRRCPEPLDDLIQVGLMGLLRAAELYKPQTMTPFGAFARPHIRGAILHYLRDSALAVRLPRRQMELHDKLRRLKASWSIEKGQEPTADDLRLALELSDEQWQELLRGQALARPMGLATGIEETSFIEGACSRPSEAEFSGTDDWGHEGLAVSKQLECLEPGLRVVIQKVVLLGWTYRRTAALLQVSPMTVQRRLKQGLAHMRKGLLSADAASILSFQRIPHPAPSVSPVC